MFSHFFPLILIQPTQHINDNAAPYQGTKKYVRCKQLGWIHFMSHYLEAKQSFSIVEKKYISKHYE